MILTALLVAFFAGSIPFGFILVRALGRGDIRSIGSGNIGATNVGRELGPVGWVLTLLADAGKGAAGVWIGGLITGGSAAGFAAGALGAVLGHCFTPWLRGKGGKGVATMLGAFGLLTPYAIALVVGVFAATVIVARTVSAASLAAAVALPIAVYSLGGPFAYVSAAAGVSAVVFVRHVPNIRRMLSGSEARVGGEQRQ